MWRRVSKVWVWIPEGELLVFLECRLSLVLLGFILRSRWLNYAVPLSPRVKTCVLRLIRKLAKKTFLTPGSTISITSCSLLAPIFVCTRANPLNFCFLALLPCLTPQKFLIVCRKMPWCD